MKAALSKWRLWLLGLSFVFNFFVWYAFLEERNTGILTVAFLNIGQGDAIFIRAPNGNQMLIDGGPPKVVLGELSHVMPFYDHSVDLLLVTNPDTDHIAGFVDVLKRYKVESVVEPGTISETSTYAELEKQITDKKVERIIAERDMEISLGGGVVFRIFFPDRDISGLDRNPGSIVGKLTFGSASILFTGDTTLAIEKYLVLLDGEELDSDILKIGHHGSRTATSKELVLAVTPEYAVISAGKDNRYGHPHKETIDALNEFKVKILGTYEKGRIVFLSDGNSWKIK